ncbi:hypothetical protein GX48_06979 [Paracoccidioides brasiliensis]|nr:hypothetical protein GX48_06979 [Paracoccidioides brasiliensis]
MSPSKPALPASNSYSSFRNVSACNRCRLRKNRCDQNLPRCLSCEKARVHCVGYDPTTKREIPRSYVFFLESRLAYLEKLLIENDIEFRPPEPYEGEEEFDKLAGIGLVAPPGKLPLGGDSGAARPPFVKNTKNQEKVIWARKDSNLTVKREREGDDELASDSISRPDEEDKSAIDVDIKRQEDEDDRRVEDLVSNIGMVSVQGASDPRYLGSTSGISFARVVFSAVRSSVSTNTAERAAPRPTERQKARSSTNSGTSSMRDSFFGLQARPTMKQAPFPDQAVAERLVNLYFEHANPQIPILHRGEFMEVFRRIYSVDKGRRSHRDLYLLNVVCAIGAGIIFDAKSDVHAQEEEVRLSHNTSPTPPSQKRQKLFLHQYQPEEYHASAVVDLEGFLGSSQHTDGFGGLEELQAVLLLASFALLRPVAPGLWYIIGVAVRLAIDLGLHYEDGTGIDSMSDQEENSLKAKSKDGSSGKSRDGRKVRMKVDPRERGRREWVRDLRRRLWWCTYSFDRLVSTCVGRPFGITDQVITTEFPSLLDDKYITEAGFLHPPANAASYKHVSQHYFKLRLLQSEIQQVLQHQQALMARKIGKNRSNTFMHTKLPSPFLAKFDSFRSWRDDIQRRLAEWKHSAPAPHQIGVQFSVEFLELNYWQALIMLYRQSLVVPDPLAGELSPTENISSPSMTNVEDVEDEDDIYLKVAEAGQKVLRLYRQLHRVRLVNYTYLATHHLFMAGISFLYAIWHSPVVRSHLTLDDVDFTILAATSVLGDLMEKCPPAEACRDAFERMSKATVQMCLSTTGFGSHATTETNRFNMVTPNPGNETTQSFEEQHSPPLSLGTHQQHQLFDQQQTAPVQPLFGMEVHDLFPKDSIDESECQPESQDPNCSPGAQHPVRTDQYISKEYQTRQPYPAQQSHSHPHQHLLQQCQHQVPHVQSHQQQHQHHQPYTYPSQKHETSNYHLSPRSLPHQAPYGHQYPSNRPFTDRASPATSSISVSTSITSPVIPHSNNHKTDTLYDRPTGGSDSDTTGDINMNMLPLPSFSDASSLAGGGGPNPGTGLDLGFGMAMDFQHGWNEGVGYDLFDGFFFGAVGFGAGASGFGNGDGDGDGDNGGGGNGNESSIAGGGIGGDAG